MIDARGGHTAILLLDGRVLVVGGDRSLLVDGDIGDGHVLTDAELYDPRSGTWTATATMIEARSGHTTTLLLEGTVLAVGGNTASAELYNPDAGN
jgi:hypothetical protein